MLHLDREKVKGLEVTGPGGAYTLEKTGPDEWAVVKPLKTRAGRWPVCWARATPTA